MIVGIWPPFNGEVRLDGVDVSAWDKAELVSYLGYLPQDIELLDGTVAQNIARFGEINNFENIVKAAKATGIHEMVLQFPSGYETPVGEGGLFLSGQKQRIALVLALMMIRDRLCWMNRIPTLTKQENELSSRPLSS